MTIGRYMLSLVLVLAPLVGCNEHESEPLKEKATMKEIMIPVEGMACDSCAARIKRNLTGIDGVLAATVSFDDKSAVIQYDARKLEPKRLASAIIGLGFKAGTPVEAKP